MTSISWQVPENHITPECIVRKSTFVECEERSELLENGTTLKIKMSARPYRTPNRLKIGYPDDSWKPRCAMFMLASYTSQIFSLSIEPIQSTLSQPVYYKNSYEKIAADGTVNFSIESTQPVSLGFLKPFKNFSSATLAPEITPDECPNYVQQVHVSKDIDAPIEDIQPRELRIRVKHLVSQFLLDTHARKLYLITLQPYYTPDDPVKRKLFIKE